MKKRIHWIPTTAVLGMAAISVNAAPQSFDFEDAKGVNHVQFTLDAPLESISGTGNGITGTVQFDKAAPEKTSGRIELDATSLTVGNSVMKQHLHGEGWLDVATHPSITFEVVEVRNHRSEGDRIVADIAGALTIKGITRNVVVPVTFTYLPDRLGARLGDPSVKGDLLVLRADFDINRGDFGIQPGKNTDKVAESIQLSLAIAGASPGI